MVKCLVLKKNESTSNMTTIAIVLSILAIVSSVSACVLVVRRKK
ncbi:hypothetical protein CT43_CH1779 [Bacillus thuringiensis serovar chinensis CT-43]|nr:hypothetical protein CT43_CH1779 [Bacillus thuringiensis serovar chinensis CT-43]